ncbi:MAG TPA: SRPBCC domain-containing protein [Steroidobacteraceae bacterium]
MESQKDRVIHVHQIYIKASQQAVWDAITDPQWNGKYGYQAVSEYELKPGGKYRVRANAQMKGFGLPDTILDGEVVEVNPITKLVHTYRWLFNDEHKAEGFTRLTWEIEPTSAGFCRLTVTHDVTGAPLMSAATQTPFNEQGGGGWNWILSDMKSLLETGRNMSA